MDDFFTSEEKKELFSLYRHLLQSAGDTIFWKDCQKLKKHLIKAAQCNGLQRNNFGMNPVIRSANGSHRSRRNRNERFVSHQHYASRNREGTYPVD